MTKTTETDIRLQSPTREDPQVNSRIRWVRIGGWSVAIFLGAAQGWATRFTMNPDGISYLDIGDAYWRHDWHNAINAYWSPLYSWILGFFINVIRPSAYWEYPLVHLVNFLIYVGALVSFEYFFAQLLKGIVTAESRQLGAWLYGFGYSMFMVSSLVMIGLNLVSPDMLVAAFWYVTAGLMVSIQLSPQKRKHFAFGLLLGIGYLAKTILLPVGIVATVSLGVALGRRKQHFLMSILLALVIAGPYVSICSLVKARFTIGESGRWNYLVFVNHIDPFFPPGIHRRTLLSHPTVYDFTGTLEGTYPPWKDPSYWQEGIEPRWSLTGLLGRLRIGALSYVAVLVNPFLGANLAIGFGLFALFGATLEFRNASLMLLVPCLAALLAYAILLVELRYVAPFLCTLWMVTFLRFSTRSRKLAVTALIFVISTNIVLAGIASLTLAHSSRRAADVILAAQGLHYADLQPGDKVALISTEKWMSTGGRASYVARLAGIRIAAEVVEPALFWSENSTQRTEILSLLKNTGAKGVLLLGTPPDPAAVGWTHLGGSDYYYKPL